MQPFRPPLLREDTRCHIRETRAEINRMGRCHAEIKRAISECRARLVQTREILMRIDAVIAQFNNMR